MATRLEGSSYSYSEVKQWCSLIQSYSSYKYIFSRYFNVNAIIRPHSNQPVYVVCSVNQISVHFELDSGASVSTISEFQARKLNANIHPSNSRIVAYDGNPVDIIGRTNLDVQY